MHIYNINKEENNSTRKKWSHLTKEERIKIETLRNIKNKERKRIYTQADIYRITWIPQYTISKELSRNSFENKHWRDIYKAKDAQKITDDRRIKANINHRFFIKHKSSISIIDSQLSEWKSPAEIANAILPQALWFRISPTTLYSYIHYNNPSLKRKLQFKNWYRKSNSMYKKKEKLLPNISVRTDEITNRERIWDWELDSVVSKWHLWWITTLTDRQTRMMFMKHADRLTAENTLYNVEYTLRDQIKFSITTDNWSEMSLLYIYCSKYWVDWFFCDPYSSWQKWSNERNNREIRRYLPKWTLFSDYTPEQLQEVQDKINKKPRKILGWKSSFELYYWVKINYITWEII